MSIKVGSEFPSGVKLTYIPYEPANADIKACGFPIQLDLDKELKGKKVVLVAVPGAFTPACSEHHIPPYGTHLNELKQKGVDEVIVISANDAFVLSAWGKALGLADKIKFASDPNAQFVKSVGLELDATGMGLGIRTQRFAIVIDNGKVTYFGLEDVPTEVKKSSVDAVLAHL